jgi:signal transduction histidine kinase
VLARSEAGTGRAEAVDLAALAADCITDLRARADDAEVSVVADLQPAWTQGEPALLERMIGNLIDNGIQHNEPNGLLEVWTSAGDGRVRMRVLNGGPRIDPVAVRTLTEPFRRLDRDHAGFGLGLSIVRSLIEAHGGELELRAPESGGLDVRVSLQGATAPPARDVAVSRTRGALTKS